MHQAVAPLAAATVVAAAGFAFEWALWDGTGSLRSGGVTAPELVVAGVLTLAAAVASVRWPLPGFAATVVLSTVLSVTITAWEPFAGVLLALFVVARTQAPWPARITLAAAAVPLATNAWNATAWSGPVTAANLASLLALWWGLAVGVWAVGRTMARSASRVRDLERSVEKARQAARVAERRAIARDLHDIVAHSLAGIVLQSGGARALATAPGRLPDETEALVATALGRIEEGAHQALRELHRLLVTLRSTDAAEPAEGGERLGGLAELDRLVEHARGSGLAVELRVEGEPAPLDRSIDLTVYRFVQETLANAMKHGGPGARVVLVIASADALRLETVCTPPPDAAPPRLPGGLGLIGLSERIASVGGTLTVTRDGAAHVTAARIPLAGRPDAPPSLAREDRPSPGLAP